MKRLKWLIVLLAVALGLGFTSAILGILRSADASPAAIGPRPLVPHFAFLEVDDLTASTWYSLVDLSDVTNFPHIGTNSIVLKQLHYTGVLSAAGHIDLKFGVVITMGDEASLVKWFHTSHRVRTTQFDEKWTLPEHGLNLYVNETAEELRFVATTEYTTTVAITTTTALESPVTESDVITTYADVGDLILYIEEIDAGAHADFSVGTAYSTE